MKKEESQLNHNRIDKRDESIMNSSSRNYSITFLIESLRNLLFFCALIGIIFCCLFNYYIFSNWNINYFQVASLNDLLFSSINFAVYTLILVVPLSIIISYSVFLHSSYRSIKIKYIKSISHKRKRKIIGLIFDYLYYLSIFTVITSVLTVAMMQSSQNSKIFYNKSYLELFLALFMYLLTPIIFMRTEFRIRGLYGGTAFLFGIFYLFYWLISFGNVETFRWYGYFGEVHINTNVKIEGQCDKHYLLWTGEHKSVIECWRDRSSSNQVLYVKNHGSNEVFGPFFADPPASPPYGPRGPTPPPSDRIGTEIR